MTNCHRDDNSQTEGDEQLIVCECIGVGWGLVELRKMGERRLLSKLVMFGNPNYSKLFILVMLWLWEGLRP